MTFEHKPSQDYLAYLRNVQIETQCFSRPQGTESMKNTAGGCQAAGAPTGTPRPTAAAVCSWQKGAIENANKLIRRYITKKQNFNNITDAYIMKVQKKTNNSPRQKLKFHHTKSVFAGFPNVYRMSEIVFGVRMVFANKRKSTCELIVSA